MVKCEPGIARVAFEPRLQSSKDPSSYDLWPAFFRADEMQKREMQKREAVFLEVEVQLYLPSYTHTNEAFYWHG